MSRLYRPHIPLEVRCKVAERQLCEAYRSQGILCQQILTAGSMGNRLKVLLGTLAGEKGCDVKDLRLDHDPPLAARPKERRGLGRKTYYVPDANDPDHLFYRPHGPQFEGSHLIKTNVRGDHGQHPDRVLIKKQRRLERGPKKKRGPKIRSRGFEGKSRPFPKRRKA